MKDLLRSLMVNVHILLLSLLLVGLGLGMIHPTTVQRSDGSRKRTVITVFNNTPGIPKPQTTPDDGSGDALATAPASPTQTPKAEPKTGSLPLASPPKPQEAACQPCTTGNCQNHCIGPKTPQMPSCAPTDPYHIPRPSPLYCPQAG